MMDLKEALEHMDDRNTLELTEASAFIAGWNAALKISAEIASKQPCYHNRGACGPAIHDDILKLSVPSGEGE